MKHHSFITFANCRIATAKHAILNAVRLQASDTADNTPAHDRALITQNTGRVRDAITNVRIAKKECATLTPVNLRHVDREICKLGDATVELQNSLLLWAK